ncbi:MAG TPA: hypothetical protein VHB79_21945 [Polyangiaceae bacterium]|nr:hypothetical protein [Polyangiaceae bacterium]
MSDELSAPERLVDSEGLAGDCLRRARLEPVSLPPLPPFVALRERRNERARRRWSVPMLVAALFGAAVLRGSGANEPAPSIRAELASGATNPAPATPSASILLHEAPASTHPAASVPAAPPSSPSRRARASAAPSHQTSAAPSETAGARSVSAKACAQMARSADAARALDCYAELARGDGIGAELALFETARLEGKVLRDPARALRTLASYRERFPAGSLRGEAMLAEIGWLIATGNEQRASELAQEALDSGLLHERAGELQELRRKLGQPASRE